MDERRLADRYVLRERLGEGTQGTTFDAIDLREGRVVAIKRFDVRGARSWKDVELAERETRVLAALDHPLLPHYIDHFEDDGALYLVMEKIEGRTLESMQRAGGISEVEARNFLDSAEDVLDYLRQRSPAIVHRDIKPRNVIRRADGSYVFVDFGAVTERMRVQGGSTVVGTIGYMAPEQLQGRASPATDVYAVGATTVAALTGVEPETLPHRGLRLDVRAALRGRVSEDLVLALEKMLEPDPDLRPQSLRAVLDARDDGARDARKERREKRGRQRGRERPPRSPEDEWVRSVRKVLWIVWGIGWAIVMPTLHSPTVMFIWMALIIIASAHDGALLRKARRALEEREKAQARIRIDAPTKTRVRESHEEDDFEEHEDEADRQGRRLRRS